MQQASSTDIAAEWGEYTQDNRLLKFTTVLPPDTLLIQSFSATERISGLFQMNLELLTEKDKAGQVSGEKLIGEAACLQVAIQSDFSSSPFRYFNGFISRFQVGQVDDLGAHFRAEVAPWLWLLTQDCNNRIFQNMSIPEIVKKIFNEYKGEFPKLVSFDDKLSGSYSKLDFCVQYQESSFHFISRLLEEEGIFYFFKHTENGHTLVLADSGQSIETCPHQSQADLMPQGETSQYDSVVTSWFLKHEVKPGKYTMRDFHFEIPHKNLQVAEPTVVPVKANKALEVYEYPGEYASRFSQKGRSGEVQTEAEKIVRLRMQEQEARYQEAEGYSFCRGFIAGHKFELVDPKETIGTFTITEIQHSARQFPWYRSDMNAPSQMNYTNTMVCIPEDVTFRPQRTTRKPRVAGPQTAMVVGKQGEEIWTDEYGRVKVQFHWDRQGQSDENSSCWVRVSHPWAGKNWGAVSIPRIGQEVIVDFLEGDPDRPIITGRVYNADQMHPFDLPGSAVIMGIKSNSTKGGAGYNEVSMNDTKGKELVNIHAQFDMTTTVEHDDTQTIHRNRQIAVDGTHDEKVKGDTSIEVIEGTYTHKVSAKTADYTVKGDITEKYHSKQTTTVDDCIDISSVNSHIHIFADADEITLRSGISQLTMRKDGTIDLVGTKITIQGSQEVVNKVSSQSVTCNTQMVQSQGARINTTAVGMHEISGALIKIN